MYSLQLLTAHTTHSGAAKEIGTGLAAMETLNIAHMYRLVLKAYGHLRILGEY